MTVTGWGVVPRNTHVLCRKPGSQIYPSTSGEVTYVSFRSDDFRSSTFTKGYPPRENDHMDITVGKSPHFSLIGMLHRFNPKPFSIASHSLDFKRRVVSTSVGCMKNLPDFPTSKCLWFESLLRLAVSGNPYTYSSLFSTTCRLDNI